MSLERQPLSSEQQFENIVASLEKQGISIEYLPDDSIQNPTYSPIDNKILIHRGDLKNLYEEAFHVNQHKILKKMGFVDEEGRPNLLAKWACEIEIICRNIARLEKEGHPAHDIELERARLGPYKDKLEDFFRSMSESGRARYQKLFEHTSFRNVKRVIEFDGFKK